MGGFLFLNLLLKFQKKPTKFLMVNILLLIFYIRLSEICLQAPLINKKTSLFKLV